MGIYLGVYCIDSVSLDDHLIRNMILLTEIHVHCLGMQHVEFASVILTVKVKLV